MTSAYYLQVEAARGDPEVARLEQQIDQADEKAAAIASLEAELKRREREAVEAAQLVGLEQDAMELRRQRTALENKRRKLQEHLDKHLATLRAGAEHEKAERDRAILRQYHRACLRVLIAARALGQAELAMREARRKCGNSRVWPSDTHVESARDRVIVDTRGMGGNFPPLNRSDEHLAGLLQVPAELLEGLEEPDE